MNISEHFAKTLVRVREEAGLTRAELANRSALESEQVESFETAASIPDVEELVKLAGSLEVPVGALLEGLEASPD